MELTASPRQAPRLQARRASGRGTRQRGDILLVTMVFLLVCLLGLLVSMRDGVVQTTMTGNHLARQKDVQVADIALRTLENQLTTYSGGQDLKLSAAGQPWWRDVAAGTASPTDTTSTYWDNCLGNSDTTLRCGSITVAINSTNLPYTAYAVVQPTGRWDTTSCDMGTQGQFTAVYYDVFVHLKESNGATAVDTETVYRLCTS
jgi:Tfp pilus assembly protein PilX